MTESETETPQKKDHWADLLHDPTTSETGGEENNEGVDFSRYWAMSRLLELEEAGYKDYALIFEYLQDVLLIDSSVAPQTGTLYQLKKKTKGAWTISELCKIAKTAKGPKGKGHKRLAARSPLGKLYFATEKLSACISAEGVFVSNALCALRTATGTSVAAHSRARITQLHSSDSKAIQKKLAKELSKTIPLPHLKFIAVEQTKIAPASMRETVHGIAAIFLAGHHPTMPHVSGRLLERLQQHFSAISGPKTGMNSLRGIIATKGFTRPQFTSLLQELSKIRPFQQALDGVVADLKREGMPPRLAERIGKEATRLKIEMARHPEVKETLRWQKAVEVARSHRDDTLYMPIVNSVSSAVRGAGTRSPLTEDETRAIALLAIHYVDEESAAPNQKPENEGK